MSDYFEKETITISKKQYNQMEEYLNGLADMCEKQKISIEELETENKKHLDLVGRLNVKITRLEGTLKEKPEVTDIKHLFKDLNLANLGGSTFSTRV